MPFIRDLISKGADVNQVSPGGYTCIDRLAARQFSDMGAATEIVMYMIECGATIAPRPHFHISPLLFACEAGNAILVKELLKRMSMEEITTASKILGTPIFIAAFRGRAEVVKILLEAGVDVNVRSIGGTPLEAAIAEGHSDVVDVIRAHQTQ